MGSELKEENDAAQQSLRERSSWDLRGLGVPITFRIGDPRVFSGPYDDDRGRLYTYTYVPELRNLIPASMSYSIGNCTLRTYLEQKEKQII